MRKGTVFLLTWLAVGGCQPAETPAEPGGSDIVLSPEEAVAQVRQVFQKYQADWNAPNLEGVLDVLADDVVQMTPDTVFVGKDALGANWREWFEDRTDQWEPVIDDIRASGDLVFVVGHFRETWTFISSGETESSAGEGVWIFQQDESGAWKLVLEQWFARDPEA
jgi:uncharacterized protein (TIGR02246 family)